MDMKLFMNNISKVFISLINIKIKIKKIILLII